MTIAWASNVNKKIRRSGTSWSGVNTVIEDTTLSGRTKRRLAGSYAKKTFNVTMMFTLNEYKLFMDWYENVCCNGFFAFNFPQIDDAVSSGSVNKVYRFVAGTVPNCNNPSGNKVECSMQWEEVSD